MPSRTAADPDAYGVRIFAVARWNALWESAQFRRPFFHDGTDSDNRLPADPARIVETGDRNSVFIPRTETRYYDYAPPSTCSPARLSTDSGCQCCAAGSGRPGRSRRPRTRISRQHFADRLSRA